MAGTARGKIEMLLSSGVIADDARDYWTSIYNHFVNLETAGVAEIVALYYGSGGTGTDYTGGGNPSGTSAFFVARFVPNAERDVSVYWLFQWTANNTIGVANGAPATRVGLARSIGTGGVLCAAAICTDADGADASPWQGTTNNDGADSKADPVWAAPAGGQIHLMPYNNAESGSTSVSADGLVVIYGDGFAGPYGNTRAQVLTDDDNFACVVDYDDNGLHNDGAIGCKLEALAPIAADGSRQLTPPYMLDSVNDWAPATGDSLAGSVGIVGTSPEIRVSAPSVTWRGRQPNDCYAPPQYGMRSVGVWGLPDLSNQSQDLGTGFVGRTQAEFLAHVNGLPGADTLDGLTRYIANDAAAGLGYALPWDGVTVPGSGLTPQGTDF